MAAQHGERRAQLVRHVVDKPVTLTFGQFKMSAQLFESRAKLVQLANA